MHKNICIIVFTCNRPNDLRRCLDSVKRQSFKGYDLLVVNNGKDRQTDEVLNLYPLRVVQSDVKKLSYLFNLGWKNTSAEYLVYLADDAEIAVDWINEAWASFNRHPDAAVVTGPLVSPFESSGEMHALYKRAGKNAWLGLLAKFYHNFILEGKTFEPCVLCESGSYTLGQGFLPDFKEEREVDLATTSSMMFRRSLVSSLGGFDENFMFNHADGDLFVRLRRSGYKIIYNPQMRGVHYLRIGPSRYPFIIGRDTAYFYLKDIRPKSLKGFAAALANIAILNLYWIYKAVETKNAGQLKGIMGFLKGISDFTSIKVKALWDKR